MLAAIDRALIDDTLNLTEWEEGFLDTVRGLVGWGVKLSDKQDEILEKIWKKATG